MQWEVSSRVWLESSSSFHVVLFGGSKQLSRSKKNNPEISCSPRSPFSILQLP